VSAAKPAISGTREERVKQLQGLLSVRQGQVLELFLRNCSQQQIADALEINVGVVSDHLKVVRRKYEACGLVLERKGVVKGMVVRTGTRRGPKRRDDAA
jgi:DNA-binding CsgD family transcriptional regulator